MPSYEGNPYLALFLVVNEGYVPIANLDATCEPNLETKLHYRIADQFVFQTSPNISHTPGEQPFPASGRLSLEILADTSLAGYGISQVLI
jgi:hypothetical protein